MAFAATLLPGCFGKKNVAPIAGTSAEPDKVLYAKAANDVKHGRYSVGRLALQTLINTYPDSEFLAKAKLEIAESYYKEGGTAGLKQSIVECKDFITFFPFLDEAANCQLQIAMAHYRQMEKPDRELCGDSVRSGTRAQDSTLANGNPAMLQAALGLR